MRQKDLQRKQQWELWKKLYRELEGELQRELWRLKRKVSHLSNSVQKGEDNRRWTRIEALKETLKGGSTRRGPAKPGKPSETRKRSPNGKTPNSSSRSKPKGKTVEQPLGQRNKVPLEKGGEITIIWEERESSTVAPGTFLPRHLPPNPYLP